MKRKSYFCGLAASALFAASIAFPAPASAEAFRLDLPAQPLAATLRALGSHTRTTIAFDPSTVAGYNAPPLHGAFSPAEALDLLLRSSRLTVKEVGERSFIVVRRSDAHIIPAAEVRVAPAPVGAVLVGQDEPVAPPEEIIVTAQRRSERLTDVPIAITAVSGAQLNSSGVNAVQQLGQVVPGLRVDSAGGFSQPTLRGVGSPIAGPGLNASVATYVDGFYRPGQSSNNFDLGDVEAIQVLKGPQGTLFGRNATGGAILVTTRDPTFNPSFEGKLSYGRYNEVRASAVASTGLTEKLAIGTSAQYRHTDGFVRNIFDGKKVDRANLWSIRGKLLFEPANGISFLLAYEHNHSSDGAPAATSAYKGITLANDPNLVDAVYPGAAPVAIPTRRGVVSLNSPSVFTVNADGITLRSRFDLGETTLTSYTGYRSERTRIQEDYDQTSLTFFEANFPVKQKTFTQELNISSDKNKTITWVAGLYYYDDKNPWPEYIVFSPNSPPSSAFSADSHSISYAAFFDGTYNISERLHLTLGGRYGKDKLSELSVFPNLPTLSAKKTFDSFTPRVVLRYAIASNTSVYVSASRGEKSGAFNAIGYSTVPVKPEKIDAYEVGFKTAQGSFRLETSAYYYDYRDLQVIRYIPNATILINAAKAEIYGADIQLSAKVTPALHIDFGGAYTHGRYLDFQNAPVWIGTGFPGDPIHSGSVDAHGFQMARTPTFTGNASIAYERKFAGGKFLATMSYYRTSRFFFDAGHQVSQPGYGLLGARIGWTTPDSRYTFNIYGDNLTNTNYLVQVLQQSVATAQQYGTPATYGVSLGVKF